MPTKVTWTLADLSDQLGGLQINTIRTRVLQLYRDELDIKTGGFIVYPKSKGQPYRIRASKMAPWLDEHWDLIMKDVCSKQL